jgi:hypothetical protein
MTLVPNFRVKMVTTGAISMAIAKLKPPTNA